MSTEFISFPWEEGQEAPRSKLPGIKKVNVTAILGKNWEDKHDIPVLEEGVKVTLSRDSVMTAYAGAHLKAAGLTDNLDIITGITKKNYPSEAEAMDLAIDAAFTEEEVPKSSRRLQKLSIGTEQNAEEEAATLAAEDFNGTFRLVTVRHHLPRAKTLFEEAGIRVDEAVASEDILNYYGYDTSRPFPTTLMNYGLEFGLRGIRRIPHGKNLIRKVTSVIRK